MVLGIVLTGLGLMLFFSLRHFYRMVFPPSVKMWNGPIPKKDSHSAMISELLLRYPDLEHVRAVFKDEANLADAVREYELLQQMVLSEDEYNKRLEEILKKVKIDDLPC